VGRAGDLARRPGPRTAPVRRVGVGERQARLAVRHHLSPSARAATPVEVARDLVGLHGTDPASVFLAAGARMPPEEPVVVAVERALYDQRTLVRMLGMRRTVFVLPVELAPVVQAACTRAIAAVERRKLLQFLGGAGIADDPASWLEEVEGSALRALRDRGEATAAQLSEDEPRLRRQIQVARGKKYEARVSISGRVLLLLAADGKVVRGRPRGSWISTQYRWSPMEAWLPGGLPELAAEPARVELARRWLAAFGPAPAADLRWWTGWTVGQTKQALAGLDTVEVDLDASGACGLLLADDVEPVAAPEPWAALLPALDPTVMGWAARGWFLGEHGPALFDRSGNAGPTVWWDGRIVGGWVQRADGEVAFRLLKDVGSDASSAVEEEAKRLEAWLGPARITPRFRTPLERELSA
jgi:Winged helix DNA-binding domain